MPNGRCQWDACCRGQRSGSVSSPASAIVSDTSRSWTSRTRTNSSPPRPPALPPRRAPRLRAPSPRGAVPRPRRHDAAVVAVATANVRRPSRLRVPEAASTAAKLPNPGLLERAPPPASTTPASSSCPGSSRRAGWGTRPTSRLPPSLHYVSSFVTPCSCPRPTRSFYARLDAEAVQPLCRNTCTRRHGPPCAVS